MSAKPQQNIIITKNPKNVIFTLLSALKNPQNPSSKLIVKLCATKLHQTLQKPSSSSSLIQAHLNTILALIPSLLFEVEIVATVVNIVGFLSLFSMEVNQMIGGDGCILKGLVFKLVGCRKRVLKMEVVNVLLDVCVTCLGRRRLLEVNGLDYVMLGFLQVKKSTASLNSIVITEKDDNLFLGAELSEDKLPLLLLNAAVILTNFSTTEQLRNIPRKLMEAIIPCWKEIWSNAHKQLLTSKVMNHSKLKYSYLSNVTLYNLAESIFRLSMYCSSPALISGIPSDLAVGHLFGSEASSFKNFVLENWESSVLLMRKRPESMGLGHEIFGPLPAEESMPGFLASLLRGMVSCPPVSLDRLNGLDILNDVRDTLGCPLIYQQDIRVVKTNMHSKTEDHYFQKSSRPFSYDDILKCKVAYLEGYTIAIRGMEYRVKNIAAISQLVANRFGQPSVGANLYITPPDSQGLACHCDDHCVFVLQLFGSKQWNVFPTPVFQLPRLYEQLEIPQELMTDRRQILLKEGDVLYIPRGFAHEAHTVSDLCESGGKSEFSAHLTLAIEIEPPFEWEGFAHVALHRWSYEKRNCNFASDTSEISQAFYVNILHVAIRLISYTIPVFRKGCLVAASSLPQEANDWLDESQKAVFDQIINKIHELANFTDSVNYLKMALQRNEDPFHWLRWLEHVNENDGFDLSSFDSDLDEVSRVLSIIDDDKAKAEAAYGYLKSMFCDKVLFDDAKERFKKLHDMYKEARVQFMNGMLSLHY